MDAASYIAAAGLKASYRELEIVTNNLANISSPGFKQDTPFYRLLTEEAGKLSGSALAGSVTDFSQGNLKTTGNPLDLAINGEGFFKIRTPAGTRYTRDGGFSIAQSGELVTREGFTVLDGQNGTIVIALGPGSANNISVGHNGEISVDGQITGTLGVVTFTDLNSLVKEGSQTFSTGAAPQPVVNPNIEQGVLEQSNVNALASFLRLIEINRLFEMNQKTVNTLINTINRRAIAEIASQQ